MLVVSFLLLNSIIAALRRVTTQFLRYLPQINTSAQCAPIPPWEVPLALPTVPLAFINAEDIWLFHSTNCSVELLTQDSHTFAFAWSPDATRIALIMDAGYSAPAVA